MSEQQDAELRARFDAQRRSDAGEVPSFAAMMAQARADVAEAAPMLAVHRVRMRRAMYVGGFAVAAVLAALLIVPRTHSAKDDFEKAVQAYNNSPTLGGWQSPTDGLLDVPGSQVLSTIPSVGAQ